MWLSGAALKWRSKLRLPRRCAWLAPVLAIVLSGCVHRQTATGPQAVVPALKAEKAHPAQTSGWVETRLYFGLGPADHPEQGISEIRWREFLDGEVTPRFPDGLSVQDVYGQWRGKGQSAPERERSKVLIIDYPNSADNQARVEAIRAAWKKLTGDESVLRVTMPADVSF